MMKSIMAAVATMGKQTVRTVNAAVAVQQKQILEQQQCVAELKS